ncbi:MAG: hypothetical protein WBL21_06995 [Salinimicrobium sp.]
MSRFAPHLKNPAILVGNTYKLKEPVTMYSWMDRRSKAEIMEDIESRKQTKSQERLDLQLAEVFE